MSTSLQSEAIEAWLRSALPWLVGALTFERIGDGRSNLTYKVVDEEGRRLVLRRPPFGPRLPSAHDMAREYRVLARLGEGGLPVPRVFGLCEDETVAGAPFFAMSYAPGHVLATRGDAGRLDPDARRAAGFALIDVLVDLHRADVEEIGLGDLARRDGYCERQIHRWTRQWEASRQAPDPTVERTGALLAAAIPAERGPALVHGDFKIENAVVTSGGEVEAILDWELCTLGDPRADLGILLTYWPEPDDDPLRGVGGIDAPSRADGFPTRRELSERYASRTGIELDELNFFRALAAWRLAIIIEGVLRRFRETPENANTEAGGLEAAKESLAQEALRLAASQASGATYSKSHAG